MGLKDMRENKEDARPRIGSSTGPPKIARELELKKHLGKSNWFRSRHKKAEEHQKERRGQNNRSRELDGMKDKDLAVRTVLFVEQMPGGALARRMRELFRGLGTTLGFKVKIAEHPLKL